MVTFAPLLFLLAFQDPGILVEKLRSDSVEDRDAAMLKLKELGRAAAAELEKAAKDKDGEVAGRARFLLRILELRSTLSDAFRKEMAGIEERLASAAPHTWTEVLLEADAKRRTRRPVPLLRREDLEPLVAGAIRGARSDEEWAAVCAVVLRRGYPSAAPALVERLAEETRRSGAAATLRSLGADESVSPLLDLLASREPGLRCLVLELLADFKIPAVIGKVDALLEDPDAGVRAQAAISLCLLEARDQAPRIARLLTDQEPRVRSGALAAIASLGAPKEAAADAVRLLSDPSPDVRGWAVHALGGLGARDAAPEVAKRLKDAGPFRVDDVRRDAALTLIQFRSREHYPELLAYAAGRDYKVRDEVVGALRKAGAGEGIPELVRLSRDGDDTLREGAVIMLASLGVREAVPGLVWLLGQKHPSFRSQPAQMLAGLGLKEAVPHLLPLMRDRDDLVRHDAVRAFQSVDAPEAIPALRQALKDPHSGIRQSAAAALLRQGAVVTDPELLKLLEDEERLNRAWMIRQLVDRDRKEQVALIRPKLADPEHVPRMEALRAMVRWKVREAVPEILPMLGEEGLFLRCEVLDTLAGLDVRAAIPSILKCLEDEEPVVQRVALRTLATLGVQEAAPAVRNLLTRGDSHTAESAARWLIRMGEPDGPSALWKTEGSLVYLNQRRRPKEWERLHLKSAALDVKRTRRERIEQAAAVAGFSLDWPASVSPAERAWLSAKLHVGASSFPEGLGDWLRVEFLKDPAPFGFVVEEDRLRVLRRGDECEFWERWCAERNLLPK